MSRKKNTTKRKLFTQFRILAAKEPQTLPGHSQTTEKPNKHFKTTLKQKLSDERATRALRDTTHDDLYNT